MKHDRILVTLARPIIYAWLIRNAVYYRFALMSVEEVIVYVAVFISRCYVVAKCNISHIALTTVQYIDCCRQYE